MQSTCATRLVCRGIATNYLLLIYPAENKAPAGEYLFSGIIAKL